MKKLILVVLVIIGFAGCTKDDVFLEPTQQVKPELQIVNSAGIKLETVFVTSEVAMNVKSEVAQTATIRIFDIANRVVSKENVNIKAGDNILKIYTSALPSSAYRIGLFDSMGREIGIADFNKIN
jgi:hypothetical protein